MVAATESTKKVVMNMEMGAEEFKGEKLISRLKVVQVWMEVDVKMGGRWRTEWEEENAKMKIRVVKVVVCSEVAGETIGAHAWSLRYMKKMGQLGGSHWLAQR